MPYPGAGSPEFPPHPTPVSPNNPPWSSPIAALVWFSSVVAIFIFPVLFLGPYVLMNAGAAPDGDIGKFLQSDPTAVLLQVLAVFPAHAVTLLIAYLVVTRVRRYSFTEALGWTMGGVAWWHYVLFMLSFFAVAAVVNHFAPEQDNDLMRILRSSRAAVVLVAIMATFTAPLVEEVVYRGVLYSAFQRTFGPGIAIAGVTLLFALVHLPQYYPSWSTMFLLGLLSLTLTVIRARSGNLLPCIVLHTIFNGVQSVLLLIEPSLQKAIETPDTVSTFIYLIR